MTTIRQRKPIASTNKKEVEPKAPPLLETTKKNNYFSEDNDSYDFITTGCTLLDCICGNGFPLGQVVNLVGDSSTGKTLIAMELLVNLFRKYPDALGIYHEGEARFDVNYAKAIGLDIEKVVFPNEDFSSKSIEAVSDNLTDIYKKKKPEVPCVYIIDSYDSFKNTDSDDDEAEGFNDAKKASRLTSFFQHHVDRLKANNILLVVISQTRENLSATAFGEKKRRAGGKALKFYSILEIWLAEKEKVYKTIQGDKRVVGINVVANCKKNSTGRFPYRTCEFMIRFGFGIDDLFTNISWLKDNKIYKGLMEEMELSERDIEGQTISLYTSGNKEKINKIAKTVKEKWVESENKFVIGIRKYD